MLQPQITYFCVSFNYFPIIKALHNENLHQMNIHAIRNIPTDAKSNIKQLIIHNTNDFCAEEEDIRKIVAGI